MFIPCKRFVGGSSDGTVSGSCLWPTLFVASPSGKQAYQLQNVDSPGCFFPVFRASLIPTTHSVISGNSLGWGLSLGWGDLKRPKSLLSLSPQWSAAAAEAATISSYIEMVAGGGCVTHYALITYYDHLRHRYKHLTFHRSHRVANLLGPSDCLSVYTWLLSSLVGTNSSTISLLLDYRLLGPSKHFTSLPRCNCSPSKQAIGTICSSRCSNYN